MVYGIIYYQETVVRLAEFPYFNRSVLGIVTVKILTQGPADGGREYGCGHSFSPFVKLTENRIIDIIVYHNDTASGTADKIAHQGIGIEYLTLEDYPFFRRQRRPHKEIHPGA